MSTTQAAPSQEKTTSEATPQQAPRAGSSGGSSGLRVQLRSLPYDQQMAMLRPGSQDIQMKGGGGTEAVHDAAARGIASGGGALPFADKIQGAFGVHDISNVQAHTGAQANEATGAMGANAYASGNHVVLGSGAQNLHTAAHEAAHVVQQRGGVSLSGGVGQVGDSYEQHADAVADAVVQGKSAEGLLDQMGGGSGGSAATGQTQRVVQKDEESQTCDIDDAPGASESLPAEGGTNAAGNYEDKGNVGHGTYGESDSSTGYGASVSTENGGTFAAGKEWDIWKSVVPPIPTGIPGLYLTFTPAVKAKVEVQIQGLVAGESARQYQASITGTCPVGLEYGAPPVASLYLRAGPVMQGQMSTKFDSKGLQSASGTISLDAQVNVGAQAGSGTFDYSVVLARANIGRFVGFSYTRGRGTTRGTFQIGQDIKDALAWAKRQYEYAKGLAEAGAEAVQRVGSAISDAWSWLTG